MYFNKIRVMTTFLYNIKEFHILNIMNNAVQYVNNYLLDIINQFDEPIKKNIYCDKCTQITYLLLNKNIKRVIQIGFDFGFLPLLMLLTNPIVHVNCFDTGERLYTRSCYEKLKETFGDRINITFGNSMKTLQNVTDVYDLIHIDGETTSIEVVESDIINSYRVSKQGSIIIMNNYDVPILHDLYNTYIQKYNLENLNKYYDELDDHVIKYVQKIPNLDD